MEDKKYTKKSVLIVEDESDVMKSVKTIFEAYKDQMTHLEAKTAEEAYTILFKENDHFAVDALILDTMMSYGKIEIRKRLRGEDDTYSVKTGMLLLDYIRNQEVKAKEEIPLWVSVITGRSAPNVLQCINKLLGDNGRLMTKPFNEFVLENDIAHVLGIKSKVPEIVLPEGYQPPKFSGGA
jgi:CheY-like chemotaxis protein